MNKMVFIVDDDKEFLEELADALSGSGYDVKTSSDSYEALQRIKEDPPDVILLDLRMNNMNGFEMAALLRRDAVTADIPVMAMSGFYTLREHEFLANICGINKFLKKPLLPKDVIGKMEDVFEEKRMA